MLRACGVPVGIVENAGPATRPCPTCYIIDIRSDASSGMATIERLRAAHPAVAIFAVADARSPI